MKNLTTYVSAAALALSLAVAAAPANATVLVDIATAGSVGSNQVTWTGAATGMGTITISNIATILNFNDALFNDGAFGQAAFLTLNGTVTTPNSLDTSLSAFLQKEIDGSFDFRSASNVVLLHGDFTNFWIGGLFGSHSGSLTSTGGHLTLTSSVTDLSKIFDANADFGFSNVSPAGLGGGFQQSSGTLNNFSANNVTATFGGSIPEPASWALMIMGFGGVGAMVRRRKMTAALA